MSQGLTPGKCLKRFRDSHGERYDYSLVKFSLTNKQRVDLYCEVVIICKKHGPFQQKPKNHIKKSGCPVCGGSKKLTPQQFECKANEIHNNKYKYPEPYVNNKTKLGIWCEEHGMFYCIPGDHLYKKYGCPKCAGKGKDTEQFVNEANVVHDNFFNYDKTIYLGPRINCIITCPIHGDFEQRPNNHLNNKGCPKCGRENMKEKLKLSWEQIEERARKEHGNVYKYIKEDFPNVYCKMTVICEKHEAFKQTIVNHLNGAGCPKCSVGKNISKGQKRLFKSLKKEHKNILVLVEHSIKTKQGNQYFVDIFIPELKLIVEYYGDYWHCNPEKYNTDHVIKQNKKTAKDIWNYDKNRKQDLENLGYKVFIAWENDFKNNEKQVLSNIQNFINKHTIYVKD